MTIKNNRAYSILSIKTISEENDEMLIEGIASTPTPDRSNDIVDPLGAKFKLPMPLLWQHDHEKPVGWVEFAQPTKNGIPFKARLAKIEEDGVLKDRIKEVWQSLKYKLVSAVSIGFIPKEYSYLDNGGVKFSEWEWYELSLVTIPANSEATISLVKSLDQKHLSALGLKDEDDQKNKKLNAGVTAQKTFNLKNTIKKVNTKMDINEHLKALKEKRKALQDAMQAIIEKSIETGEFGDATADQQFEESKAEIEAIDAQIKKVEDMQKLSKENAKSVEVKNSTDASESRSGIISSAYQIDTSKKGSDFAKYVSCLALAKGNRTEAKTIAEHRFPNASRVHNILKAASAAGTTTDATWAAPLVDYQTAAGEFVELLRDATILDKLSLRKIPFNTRMPVQTGGSTTNWVGEGLAKPVGELAFDTIELGFSKAAGILVASDELLRFSNPAAEQLMIDDLIKQMAQFLDQQFLDPSVASSAANPASITNGVTALTSSDNFRTDLTTAITYFASHNLGAANIACIMNSSLAAQLAFDVDTLTNQPVFPGITVSGGNYKGIKIIVSDNVPGDTAGPLVIFVKESEILLADDGQVVIDASNQATLNMNNAPGTGAATFNLWQNNCVGIRAERFINWKRRRAEAVVVFSGANYTPA